MIVLFAAPWRSRQQPLCSHKAAGRCYSLGWSMYARHPPPKKIYQYHMVYICTSFLHFLVSHMIIKLLIKHLVQLLLCPWILFFFPLSWNMLMHGNILFEKDGIIKKRLVGLEFFIDTTNYRIKEHIFICVIVNYLFHYKEHQSLLQFQLNLECFMVLHKSLVQMRLSCFL